MERCRKDEAVESKMSEEDYAAAKAGRPGQGKVVSVGLQRWKRRAGKRDQDEGSG